MIDIKSGLQKVFNLSKKTVYKPVSPVIIEKVAVLSRDSFRLPSEFCHIRDSLLDLESAMTEVQVPDNEESLRLEAVLDRKIRMVSFCLKNCVCGIRSGEINRHLDDINNLISPLGKKKTRQ